MKELSKQGKKDLRQAEWSRAVSLGFTDLKRVNSKRAKSQSVRLRDLHQYIKMKFLNYEVYASLLTLGAAAEAINHRIVVWVPSPNDDTYVTVHRMPSTHGSLLHVHVPVNPRGTIHLRFYDYSDQRNANVELFASGLQGHFELLQEPVNGWDKCATRWGI